MNPPPDDNPSTGSETADRPPAATDDQSPETSVDQPEDAIEPASQREEIPEQSPVSTPPDSAAQQQTPEHGETTAVDDTAVKNDIDSNWWYWVAAVPIYVVVGIVAGMIAAMLFVFGLAVDVAGGMGLATGLVMLLLLVGVIGYALAGLALSVLFPVGIYLDAKALAASDCSWEPDAVLYLLVAAASVILSAFSLSAVVALYYLYRRNQAVGVP